MRTRTWQATDLTYSSATGGLCATNVTCNNKKKTFFPLRSSVLRQQTSGTAVGSSLDRMHLQQSVWECICWKKVLNGQWSTNDRSKFHTFPMKTKRESNTSQLIFFFFFSPVLVFRFRTQNSKDKKAQMLLQFTS